MKKLILILLNTYQKTFSPDHGFVSGSGTAMRCRFYPSCSQYAIEAVERYGIGRGMAKSVWRVLRCSPLSKGGIDPA
jgi:hypothetical protein